MTTLDKEKFKTEEIGKMMPTSVITNYVKGFKRMGPNNKKSLRRAFNCYHNVEKWTKQPRNSQHSHSTQEIH